MIEARSPPGLTMATLKPGAGWIPTGVASGPGRIVAVTAGGAIKVSRGDGLFVVSPPGTNIKPRGMFKHGPTYALLGRIGEKGTPFVVGEFWQSKATDDGGLFLAVNAPEGSKADGEYLAAIRSEKRSSREISPLGPRKQLPALTAPGKVPDKCRVLWYYIDGARPDVIRRMVAEGALPNIRRIFYEGGVEFPYTLGQFPSETISTNATLRTGVGSATHGVKGPIGFNRRRCTFANRLSRFGPGDTADFIRPHSIASHIAAWFGARPKGGPRAVYDYLPWGRYQASAVPVHPHAPDMFWAHFAVNRTRLLRLDLAWLNMDEISAMWGSEEGLTSNAELVEVWASDTDSVSHISPRGQFGRTRAILAKADFLLGLLIARLEERGEFERTYIFLFSDHGHLGGDAAVLRRYDPGNELFFAPPESGGLGLNVRKLRYVRQRKGEGAGRFVVIPTPCEGFCEFFLPRDSFMTGSPGERNDLGTLLNYETPAGRINLIRKLLEARPSRGFSGKLLTPPYPVDIVIVPTESNTAFLATRDRGWAVVERKKTSEDILYRYETIVPPSTGDEAKIKIIRTPAAKDPLGYIDTGAERLMGGWHSSRCWLYATAHLDRPDAVPAIGEYVSLAERIKRRGIDYMPDLVAVASRGWFFSEEAYEGTMHGHPYPECMLCTLYIAGPGIPRGAVVGQPVRLYDVLPTTLELLGTNYERGTLEAKSVFGLNAPAFLVDAKYDARPISATLPFERPRVWESSTTFLRDPDNPWDLHNIFTNVVSFMGNSLVRLADEAKAPDGSLKNVPAQRGANRLFWSTDPPQSSTDRHGRAFVRALRLDKWSIGDTVGGEIFTLGHLMRLGRLIDWMQVLAADVDGSLGKPLGLPSGFATPLTNPVIDGAQEMVWLSMNKVVRFVYRVVDEVVIVGVESIAETVINIGGPKEDRREKE